MRGRTSAVASSSPSTCSATPARAACSSSSATHLAQHRQHGLGAERDDTRPRLELGEEEHLVDQLADLVDLAARLLDELRHVLARQRRELEQREQPRERRPQLVRDGGREARAQLLVGGEVAGLGEVDEPLRRVRRPRTGRSSARSLCEQVAALSSSPSRTPSDWRARRLAVSDDPVLVEHDDRLAALLEQHLAPHARIWIHQRPLPLLHPSTAPSRVA